jgi:hypothetical protein
VTRQLGIGSIAASLTAALVFGSVALASTPVTETGQKKTASTPYHRPPSAELPTSAKQYYERLWGVDILGVKAVSSGLMLRFSYRVVDAKRAQILNDKKLNPQLIDQTTRASLVIPTMEKVGQLRQTSTPENGREYWMLFSNKGNLVKPGNRVDVVIGNFRAEGLIVREE